jgi:hypothetical protein
MTCIELVTWQDAICRGLFAHIRDALAAVIEHMSQFERVVSVMARTGDCFPAEGSDGESRLYR